MVFTAAVYDRRQYMTAGSVWLRLRAAKPEEKDDKVYVE